VWHAYPAPFLVGTHNGRPGSVVPVTSPSVVLAHQGGWDEMLFVLVPLLVFFTLQWLNRRKGRAGGDDVEGPPAQ
jgi:hypothetical protein